MRVNPLVALAGAFFVGWAISELMNRKNTIQLQRAFISQNELELRKQRALNGQLKKDLFRQHLVINQINTVVNEAAEQKSAPQERERMGYVKDKI